MGEREAGGKGAKGRENLGRKGEKDKEGLASVYLDLRRVCDTISPRIEGLQCL